VSCCLIVVSFILKYQEEESSDQVHWKKEQQRCPGTDNPQPDIVPTPKAFTPEVKSFLYQSDHNASGIQGGPVHTQKGQNETPEKMELQIPSENPHHYDGTFFVFFLTTSFVILLLDFLCP
jgi:hypothetical protein